MQNDERLKDLFKEINEKPEHLDDSIMQAIYLQAKSDKKTQKTPTSWNWTYFIIGLFSLAGV